MSTGNEVVLEILARVLSQLERRRYLDNKRVVSCVEVIVRLALAHPKGAPLRLPRMQKAYGLSREEFKAILSALAKVGTLTTYFTLPAVDR